MTRTHIHPKDGWLLRPNEMPNSYDRTNGFTRHLREEEAASLSVTRYHQAWTLLPDYDQSINAKMTVDYYVTAGQYNSGFKSITDLASSVKDIRVTNGNNNSTLYHEISEKNDFVFVQWWFEQTLTAGDVATTVVEYTIESGVDACRNDGFSEDNERNVSSVACLQSFDAPWANYWSIPVSSITYEFRLPVESEGISYKFVEDSLTLLEPSQCCSSDALVYRGDGETTGPYISQSFTSDELAIGARNPKNIKFGWETKVFDERANFCRMTCTNNDGEANSSNSLLWLLTLLPVFALILAVFCTWQRRKRQQQNFEEEESGLTQTKSVTEAVPLYGAKSLSKGKLPPAEQRSHEKNEDARDGFSIGTDINTDDSAVDTTQQPKVLLCTVCLVNEINTVLLPCAHRAVCISCGKGLSSCPICRATIRECVRTFDA